MKYSILKYLRKKKELKKYEKIILESGLFDASYYKKKYNIRGSAIKYYLEHGLVNDHKPNDFFDPVWYRKFYKDIAKNSVTPFIHYIIYGIKEKRFANEKEFLNSNGINENESQDKQDDYTVIQNSNQFDTDFYLTSYPDVKNSNMDPLKHFCEYGWKEGRNPNPTFDTVYYLQENTDVKEAGINPLVHYIRYGKREGRAAFPDQYSTIPYINKVFVDNFEKTLVSESEQIDIIIPVYNGFEFLEPLFKSIFEHTSLPYRLLICDDKSPDPKVLPFLQDLQKKHTDKSIFILTNSENLGFVGTVNRLVKHTKNHFVLLNTDTEVPSYWIERLMYPILNMDKVATTTPFTNAGTICSFPNYLEDNKIFEGMNVEELDNYFKKINFQNTYIEVPTGVGFCMGVNKKLVDEIGMFDTVFGKGYGEENDLCQRAIQHGYKNIHVTNLFVYHKHGGSFPSEEKMRLIEKNLKILNEKHPSYSKDIDSVVKKDALKYLRNLLYFKIKSDKQYSTLILDHALGGGANHYIDMDIKRRLKQKEVICLIRYDFIKSKQFKCTLMSEKKSFSFVMGDLKELEDTLHFFKFDELYLNSLVSYADVFSTIKTIRKLYEKHHFKLFIPIHDYFPICPSYTLLDENDMYCDVPKDKTKCLTCLINHQGEFKQFEKTSDIGKWRQSWETLIEISERVICFSNASKDIFQKAYPSFSHKIDVTPHDISGRFDSIYTPSFSNQRVIGILGGINIPKGATIIKKLVEHIDFNKLDVKVVLIGDISIPIHSPSFDKTGKYMTEDLPQIIKKYEITDFLIPSIWPETFSYVTDEIMQLGYPLTVFDIGAPAERVRRYELGRVVEVGNIEAVLSEFN